jgi:4-aminobutyrate aminotransferase/(S)-3-amino-2-methylpropionate transaminase
VAEICRARGILLIADEVQTGIARTGRMFACEHEGIEPDLVTTAKGLAGGLPLGAVTGRAELMDAAPAGGLGGTFSGNPVACEAALGVFDEIESNDLLARARAIGDIMIERLGAFADSHPAIGEVRGRGAMTAVELVEPHGDRTPAPDLAAGIARRCHAEGLLVLTAGSYGNVLRFLPPLSISDSLLDEGLALLGKAIAEETACAA